MVLAGMPVSSFMRLAARPVGAARRVLTPNDCRMSSSALMMVVLPVPGPPVITSTPPRSACATASRWFGASVRRCVRSNLAISASGSIFGSSLPVDSSTRSDAATPTSWRWSDAR